MKYAFYGKILHKKAYFFRRCLFKPSFLYWEDFEPVYETSCSIADCFSEHKKNIVLFLYSCLYVSTSLSAVIYFRDYNPRSLHRKTRNRDTAPDAAVPAIIKGLCLPTRTAGDFLSAACSDTESFRFPLPGLLPREISASRNYHARNRRSERK